MNAPEMPRVEGVSHRHVAVRGVRIHVAEAGSGEPIVLQHGWPQCWWTWRGLIPALAERHRVICPDLRGHGWSEAPRGGYDKEGLAQDLLGVLDALSLERVRLVGHDWGGYIGFLACLRAPERFVGFVACSVPHPFRTPAERSLAQLAPLAYQGLLAAPILGGALLRRVPGFVQTMMSRSAGSASALEPEALALYADLARDPDRAAAMVALYRTFLTRELLPLLSGAHAGRRLTVPTRLLAGERDPVVPPASLGGFEEHADDMAVEVIAGAGHWLPEEVPGILAARALALFGG